MWGVQDMNMQETQSHHSNLITAQELNQDINHGLDP